MKGIIFNLLEEVVRGHHGDEAWDGLLEASGLDGAYTSLGSYPDEHLVKLVVAASAALGQPPEAIVRWFGKNALPLLAQRFPDFFEGHVSARTFLLTLNDVIHTEVRKIYPGADVPVFTYEAVSDDALILGYRSARRLCALAEGFIEAAAEHYGERAVVEQTTCMQRGDARCAFKIALTRSPG